MTAVPSKATVTAVPSKATDVQQEASEDGFADVTLVQDAGAPLPRAASAPIEASQKSDEDPETRRASTAKVYQRSERSRASFATSNADALSDVDLKLPVEDAKATENAVEVEPVPQNVTETPAEENSKARPPAGDRFPLGLARFLAALHVVIFHLFAEGVTAGVYLYAWGFTWVPWFFMLSGFVLGNGHLCRPNKETWRLPCGG
eukprot:Skav221011  [mRNA]  locus=scaffold2350:140627:146319:- [translate_table: standard]